MSKNQAVIEPALEMVSGPVFAGNLMEKLKEALLKDPVMRKLFGNAGESIFVDKMPNYNKTITPFIEFYWTRDTYTNHDVHFSGTILGRIGLPPQLAGDVNKQRILAAIFQRFLGTDSCYSMLHPTVPGLIEFAVGSVFEYDRLMDLDGLKIPVITMTLPYKIDLYMFRKAHPEVDFDALLSGDLLEDFEAYKLVLVDDSEHDLLEREVTLED
ncbi:hypothetical protein [Bdellovibrio bacteriovorus]|uniref:hypothetical protein n=1 Tax=Bdellovibrio bacteriovorus TaxID=959 RepID=UPI003AA81D92